jgi:hypothetical protein
VADGYSARLEVPETARGVTLVREMSPTGFETWSVLAAVVCQLHSLRMHHNSPRPSSRRLSMSFETPPACC